jgi:hypothetical protein
LCFRSIETEEKTVIDDAGIVNAVRIDNHDAGHSTKLDQMMPVSAVSGKPRCFDAEYSSNLTGADFTHQTLKARPLYHPGAGSPEIVINHDNVPESELSRAFYQAVLPSLAFLIVQDLSH